MKKGGDATVTYPVGSCWSASSLNESGWHAIWDALLHVSVSRLVAVADGRVVAAEGEQGRFQEWDMNRTRWGELALKVGPAAGYVFCHQGCCEHLLVVKDVRQIHADDPQDLAAYPVCIREVCRLRFSLHFLKSAKTSVKQFVWLGLD